MNPFLIGVLALPAVSFHAITVPAPEGPPMIPAPYHVTFSKFLSHEQRILIVGGDPSWVTMFRAARLTAFGAYTQDWPALPTAYHAVADAVNLPFADDTFQAVYWIHPKVFGSSGLVYLGEASRLIQNGGYLLFNPNRYPDWVEWLRHRPWDRMPFRLGDLVIYKKRLQDHRGLHEHGGRRSQGSAYTRRVESSA